MVTKSFCEGCERQHNDLTVPVILNFEVSFVPNYNLNRKKWTKVVLLILASIFILSAVFPLVIYLIALMG